MNVDHFLEQSAAKPQISPENYKTCDHDKGSIPFFFTVLEMLTSLPHLRCHNLKGKSCFIQIKMCNRIVNFSPSCCSWVKITHDATLKSIPFI